MSDCAVFGCTPEPGASIHYLPRNPALKQEWMDFIYRFRLSRPSNTVGLRICGAHFTNDCFVNFFQRSMGYAKKLILKPDAVPSIYPGYPTWLRHGASVSCLNRSDVACQSNSVVLHEVGLQCSLPAIRTRTVGTQLSERRPIYRRNLGTSADTVETRVAEQSIGWLISTFQRPPPSPSTDWSQPEIEDDGGCVTVVTHLFLQVSFSRGGIKYCCHHSAAGTLNRDFVLVRCRVDAACSVCILITIECLLLNKRLDQFI